MQRKSIIAEALKYEAVQGASSPDTMTPSPDTSPHHYREQPIKASVFSAFIKDVTKGEMDGFEPGRAGNNVPDNKSPVNDMTKQCSMIHRMMEMDKTDIDPRDVHKLLPSTMLTSDSLDLRPDSVVGRISQGLAGMDLHSLMEDQALKFAAGTVEKETAKVNKNNAVVVELKESDEQRIVPESNNNGNATVVVSSSTSPQPPRSSPGSPVTGWPAAPVLGIMHPMNHTLCRVPPGSNPATVAADLLTTTAAATTTTTTTSHPIVYPETTAAAASTSAMACMARGSPTTTTVVLDWTTYPTAHHHHHHHVYPAPTYAVPREQQLQQEGTYNCGYHSATVLAPEGSEAFSNNDSESSGSSSSDKDGTSEDSASAKKFKSLEAALAWCHVQHSQKQVPVVPKDDVRKLVDFQLNSGKPIRAPWYRPQTEKLEEPQSRPIEKKPVVEKKPMIPRPDRLRRSVNAGATVKKQGTGFFCPPGSTMARV